jgi:hypothetical protein
LRPGRSRGKFSFPEIIDLWREYRRGLKQIQDDSGSTEPSDSFSDPDFRQPELNKPLLIFLVRKGEMRLISSGDGYYSPVAADIQPEISGNNPYSRW